jgi:quinol monooxygenase YgiN
MKRMSVTLASSMVLLLLSCNSGPAKEETQSADTTTAVANPPPETKPAFIPFKVVVVQHKVKNFAKSEAEYFNRDSLRKSYGITHYVIGRDLKDSNTVFVIDKIEDMAKAKSFYAQPGAKDAMKKAGVSSPPGFTYAEFIRGNDSPVQYLDGVAVSHHVKDFDTWLKAFDAEGAATRSANGLIDRGIARNLQDPRTVTILFEVSDTAKAKARIKSPELKKIMKDAGVDSPPTIRWYRLIK